MLDRIRLWISHLWADDPEPMEYAPHQAVHQQGALIMTCACGRRYVVQEARRDGAPAAP